MKHALSKYNGVQDSSGLIPEDEPVFLLRGTDPLTAKVIRHWVLLASDIGVSEERLEIALKQAENIEQYQKANGTVLPGTSD